MRINPEWNPRELQAESVDASVESYDPYGDLDEEEESDNA
jgi:hypothetical protein